MRGLATNARIEKPKLRADFKMVLDLASASEKGIYTGRLAAPGALETESLKPSKIPVSKDARTASSAHPGHLCDTLGITLGSTQFP